MEVQDREKGEGIQAPPHSLLDICRTVCSILRGLEYAVKSLLAAETTLPARYRSFAP